MSGVAAVAAGLCLPLPSKCQDLDDTDHGGQTTSDYYLALQFRHIATILKKPLQVAYSGTAESLRPKAHSAGTDPPSTPSRERV